MAGHERKEFAEFSSGDECFVYARRRDDPDGPAYRLADRPVTADGRAWMVRHLECPIPGCADTRIHPVDRSASGRRVGFSHYGGSGGHSRESVDHHMSKLMIAAWALTAYPGCVAVVEQTTDDLSRRADVMITFPSGQRLAVEVQYAGLTVERWAERHDSYHRQGIACVWLWGHRPPHLQPDPDTPDGLRLTPLHLAIIKRGLPLLWVNPDGWIGTATTTIHGLTVPATADPWQDRTFTADPVDQCALNEAGISTPTLAAAVANLPAVADTLRRQAAAAAAAESRRLAEEAAYAERARQAQYAAERRAEQEREWVTSSLRAQLLARFNGTLPAPITVRAAGDGGVFAAPEAWHTIICRDLLHGRAGATFTVADVYRALTSAGIALHPNRMAHARAVTSYLSALARLGLLKLDLDPTRPKFITVCTVVKDLDTYERDRQEKRRRQQAEVEAEAKALAEQVRRRSARPAPEPAGQQTRPPQPARPAPGRLACRVCLQPLDPVYKRFGTHLGCERT